MRSPHHCEFIYISLGGATVRAHCPKASFALMLSHKNAKFIPAKLAGLDRTPFNVRLVLLKYPDAASIHNPLLLEIIKYI